ncbi:MAG: helix-turn-helix domain-containing protein [Pseudonocardiaceae bacterium]
MTEMIPWEQVRAEALESGRVTPDALTRAQIEQDTHVAGYRLAELRAKAGMTQTQLADAMGVSQARVSAMERGEVDSLTVASARAYITALGGTVKIVVSLDDTDITLRLPGDPRSTAA